MHRDSVSEFLMKNVERFQSTIDDSMPCPNHFEKLLLCKSSILKKHARIVLITSVGYDLFFAPKVQLQILPKYAQIRVASAGERAVDPYNITATNAYAILV